MRNLVALFFAIFLYNVCFSQNIPYTNCRNCWNPDSLGNHRAVVHFNGTGKYALAVIPWRRSDNNPEEKRIIVEDAKTKKRILNVVVGHVDNEEGKIFFEPTSGKGDYYVYYMPYKNEGRSNYPKGVYLKQDNTATDTWSSCNNKQMQPNAVVTAFQSIDAFNSFYPMEVIATAKETDKLRSQYAGKAFVVFPEDREHSIRMKNYLPQRWITSGAKQTFKGAAAKGEYYAYQLGVYALKSLNNVKVSFSNLKSTGGNTITAKDINCINTNGVSYDDKSFIQTVNVDANTVQALWCGIDVKKTATAGAYTGTATVTADGTQPVTINITLTVKNETLNDGGVNEPWKMTRLNWLNSTMAQENIPIAPYTALQVSGDSIIDLLGRKVVLNKDGFPKQIQTFFTEEMTGTSDKANNILAEAIHFHLTKNVDGKDVQFTKKDFHFTEKTNGTVRWESALSSDEMQMDVNASLEFDGFMHYTVKLTALKDIDFKDIAMHIPFQKSMADYLMGLGQKGGNRPEKLEWKWDVAHKNQDGAWIGNVNAGLQFSLRDEKYVRPLNTNFYLLKPLLLPTSWGNDNKGGIDVGVKGSSMLVNNYSGARSMKKGDTLYYNFNLLITPFHTINTDFQWSTRFYHKYENLDSVKAAGATVVNIHHGTPINPWINYPFIEWKKMKNYIDSAHHLGLKVKIYNTIRELSNHAYETFVLRSLGHEVYSPGKGGGFSWLQEHVKDDYIAAWFVPEYKDAAIINSGMNRWHNYYVEGMNWLVNNVGIDGIYLDDVAFDRVTMKRVKRVLTQNSHPGIIDLHSANQYNKSDGFNNSANLYMESFPYINRLWFGEYFDYEKNNPDFFLTEVSGIPFGLMGEMLQDGGNSWRGMVYGMTNRMPWSDNADPRPIWKVWDDFGIKGSEMIGYWSSNCPVKTDNAKVLATIYNKKGKALIAIASWAEENTNVHLQIDWSKLGVNASKVIIHAPFIKNFQQEKTFNVNDAIPIEKNKGWLIEVSE